MADTLESLRERRAALETRLNGRGLLHTLSAARYQLNREVGSAIKQWAMGDVLEAGSGRSPHRSLLAQRVTSITTLDIDPGHTPDVLADVQEMSEVPDKAFDVILTTQVLEHVPRPWDAFREFARVLKPDGILILSAPHLSMVHDAPHDYYRYTGYGLSELCEANSFEIVDIRPVGGLLSWIGHVVSLGLLSVIGGVPGLFWPVWAVNYLFLVRGLDALDGLLGLQALLPRDHLLVARRV